MRSWIETMPVRALIVDDNAQFLEAASALLERQGITIVGVASTGVDARRRLDETRPDVVLVDIDLGEESGLDLAHADRRRRSARSTAHHSHLRVPRRRHRGPARRFPGSRLLVEVVAFGRRDRSNPAGRCGALGEPVGGTALPNLGSRGGVGACSGRSAQRSSWSHETDDATLGPRHARRAPRSLRPSQQWSRCCSRTCPCRAWRCSTSPRFSSSLSSGVWRSPCWCRSPALSCSPSSCRRKERTSSPTGRICSALAVYLVTALVVGQLAARLRRNTREATRLAGEQAALRRVATLVAQSAPSSEIFEAVTPRGRPALRCGLGPHGAIRDRRHGEGCGGVESDGGGARRRHSLRARGRQRGRLGARRGYPGAHRHLLERPRPHRRGSPLGRHPVVSRLSDRGERKPVGGDRRLVEG